MAGLGHSIDKNLAFTKNAERMLALLQRMRSEAERAQRDLWRLASQKGWYVPSAPADPQEVAGLARQLGLAETQPVRV